MSCYKEIPPYPIQGSTYEDLESENLMLKAENERLKKELAELHFAYSEYEPLGEKRNKNRRENIKKQLESAVENGYRFPLKINNKMDLYILANSIVTAYERFKFLETLIEKESDSKIKNTLANEYMRIGNIYNFA